jgi:superfamily II DNA or RNA helicase
MRAIICCPQIIIAENFRKVPLPHERDFTLQPKLDLTINQSKKNTDRIKEFLRGKPKKKINDRTVICSHSTLTRALKTWEGPLPKIFLSIDECHHLSTSESNQLGEAIKPLLADPKQEINLTTATLFRNDKHQVVKDTSQWTTFYYPLHKYLKDTIYLRSFQYIFKTFNKKPIECIESIVNEDPTKPRIIFIPQVQSKIWKCPKNQKIKQLIQIFEKAAGGKAFRDPKHLNKNLFTINGDKKKIRVLDLITEENRSNTVATLINNPESFDAILTLNVGKEGANWPRAEQAIVVDFRPSLNETTQILGRLLRDYPGKPHVEMINLIPWEKKNPEKLSEALNKYVNVVLQTVAIGASFKPELKYIHKYNVQQIKNILRRAIKSIVDRKPSNRKETSETIRDALSDIPEHLRKEIQDIIESCILLTETEDVDDYEKVLNFMSPKQDHQCLKAIEDIFTNKVCSLDKFLQCCRENKFNVVRDYQYFRKKYPKLKLPQDPETAYKFYGIETLPVILRSYQTNNGLSPYIGKNMETFWYALILAADSKNLKKPNIIPHPEFTFWANQNKKSVLIFIKKQKNAKAVIQKIKKSEPIQKTVLDITKERLKKAA